MSADQLMIIMTAVVAFIFGRMTSSPAMTNEHYPMISVEIIG